jgi:lipopolysaccharide/colanic/teichoic acid biosynthesis glycosyltransferase
MYRKSSSGQLSAVIVGDNRADTEESLGLFDGRYIIAGYFGKESRPGYPHLGDLDRLGEFLRENKIARVILDLSPDNFENLNPLFSSAFYMETRFLVANRDQENFKGLRKTATRYAGIYIISLSHRQIFAKLLKRIFDFSFAGILLALSSPYLLIRLIYESSQRKLSSRRVTAITKGCRECELWGSRLRGNYHVRNIWGLISVLKGDLSLVGTTITYKSDLKAPGLSHGIWRKFLVRPGLFGPGYQAASPEESFSADLRYAENATILYDIAFLLGQLFGISSIRKSGSA